MPKKDAKKKPTVKIDIMLAGALPGVGMPKKSGNKGGKKC